MQEIDPVHEAVYLRRAAEACRNLRRQAKNGGEWAAWVPAHLDNLADRIDPRDPEDRGLAFIPRTEVTT